MNSSEKHTYEKMVNLKPYNTFGVEAKARFFATIRTPRDIKTLLIENHLGNISRFILGGGSNVLFTGTYPGLVIKNDIKGIEIVSEDQSSILLKIGAGENWHELVMLCVEKGWAGIENLALIPGTVGAAPIQNIGAYGVELESVFHSLEAIHIKNGTQHTFYKKDCHFGYRNSIFKQDLKGEYAIVNVRLQLNKSGPVSLEYNSLSKKLEENNILNPNLRDVAEAVIAIRQSKLPNPHEIGNAGSFFKNPVIRKDKYEQLKNRYPEMPCYAIDQNHIKIPAGWLIDKAGWKGVEKNGAAVHKNQALVLINKKNARAEDILALASEIKSDIFKRFNISLEEEVSIV